jgi:hypothetical protein
MSTHRRLAALATLSIVALFAAPSALAASQITECGQFPAYTAPDPLGPTDGSLQLGQLPAWTIADDATLVSPADTVLPSLSGSGAVTCLQIDLDDDSVITSVALVGEGTIEGHVAFESGLDAYLFHDRLMLPTFVTDMYPGLGALFGPSAAGGSVLRVTFLLDASNGVITGISGRTVVCGPPDVDGDGNGLLGDAVIPSAVLDADDVAALTDPAAIDACATIETAGTIDSGTGELDLVTDVAIAIDAAPTAPPTSSSGPATGSSTPDNGLGWVFVVVIFGVSLVLASVRRPRISSR